MTDLLHDKIKAQLKKILQEEGNITDDEELITSGRLNSLKTVELASWLEKNYLIDFGKIGFNLYDFESISSITNLIQKNRIK